MLKLQPWTGERAGALLSDVRPDSEPTYCVRAVFRRRTRTEQTSAEGLLHALWEATDREAVRRLYRYLVPPDHVRNAGRRSLRPRSPQRSRGTPSLWISSVTVRAHIQNAVNARAAHRTGRAWRQALAGRSLARCRIGRVASAAPCSSTVSTSSMLGSKTSDTPTSYDAPTR